MVRSITLALLVLAVLGCSLPLASTSTLALSNAGGTNVYVTIPSRFYGEVRSGQVFYLTLHETIDSVHVYLYEVPSGSTRDFYARLGSVVEVGF